MRACRGLKIRGVIISELKRNTYWRISPDFFTIRPKWGINRDFYKTHPDGAFTIHMSFEEIEKAMKQRTKLRKKAIKGRFEPKKKDNAGSV